MLMPMILGFMSEKMLLSDAGIQTTQVLMMLTKSVAYAGFYCGEGVRKRGLGFWGRGSQPSPHHLGELESAVSYPSGIRPEPRPPNGFAYI